jgi:hypothetical protein
MLRSGGLDEDHVGNGRYQRKTFTNAEASFQALNQALKERAEARGNRRAEPAG